MAYLSNFPGPVWLAVTSRYGWRWGRLHRGTDYGSPNLALYQIFRAPIYAPFSGAFTRGYEDGGAGNWAWVSRQGVLFKAFHLDSYAVDNGAWVEAGDLIGWTGTTGASTGPHDHFELWIGGADIDPEPHIEAARSTPPLPPSPPEEELDVTAEANLTAKIDASTAQILASLGIPQGTSVKVEIDGVEHDLADNITEAGWSGREYLVGVGHHLPDGTLDTSADDGKVYELRRIDEAPFWARVHVRGVANPANGEPFRSLLVRTGRNPHVVWIDPDDPAAAELLALPELG